MKRYNKVRRLIESYLIELAAVGALDTADNDLTTISPENLISLNYINEFYGSNPNHPEATSAEILQIVTVWQYDFLEDGP